MTTEQLRKVIGVTDWNLTTNGLTISYLREDHAPKALHLILTPEDALRELSIVGSVDDFILEGNNKDWPSKACIDDHWYDMKQFASFYKMCQWEALSIAIRHEAEKELVKDTNMLEIDNILKSLK